MQNLKLFRRVLVPGAILAMVAGNALAANPITMDSVYLSYSKTRLAAQDPAFTPALNKLLQDANVLITKPSEAVTLKKIVPPSGDKHDYMSLAPYWWPDPSKSNGLPYIQRDGQFNPSAKNGDTDSVRMQYMCLGIQNLSLAYYFTGDVKYAQKAGEAIRTWFLNTATRMNPNLKYGQAIMGRIEGRGIGLIDTRNLWMVADAVPLIEPSGVLTAAEVTALKKWFTDFSNWMLTNQLGKDEAAATNNHGTYYDMQIAAYSLFTGNTAKAKSTVQSALTKRIQTQIAKDGKQPQELSRTTPFHYSAFNLDAMTNLARYGEQVGVVVWTVNPTTNGLRHGIDYILPFAVKPSSWPYAELDRAETEMMLPVLLRAERAYKSGAYATAVSTMPVTQFNTQEVIGMASALGTQKPTTLNYVDRLIWPVKP
ncbi:MAG: hypothetical protein JWL63_1017 [Rhodocyclales bacterium]|nr:hypothetical protein [Rhodocyclales bacterium]